MVRRKVSVLLSIVVLVSLTACNLGASNSGNGGGVEPTVTAVPTSIVPTNPTYEVQRGDVVEELQFAAKIAPVQEETLFFKTGGWVDAVYINRDDPVLAGDLLAELEVSDLKNQITQQEAQLTSVQINYERRVTEAQNNVRSAELQLLKLEASRSQAGVINARNNLARAQENLVNAQDEYTKSLDRDWEKEEVRESYANAVVNAERNLESAQAAYQDALNAQLRLTYDIELAQMNFNEAELALSELETGLDVTKTLLSLERLTAQLDDARIVAPFDGMVVSLSLITGKQVQGYQDVIVIADPTELEVSADLPDSDLSNLSEGMMVVVELVNRPGEEMMGEIRRLPYPYNSGASVSDTVVDEDPTVRITLIDFDYSTVEMGDRLRVTVELERSENTIWLPPQAVRTFEGRSFVVVQEGAGQRRVDVTIGLRAQDRLEILEGLDEGQIVIAP